MADRSTTTDAWMIKEKLLWTQEAPTPRAGRWRITNYFKVMKAAVSENPLLKPMGKALATMERHADAVVRRWLFQAARSLVRVKRDEPNFNAMIYLIGSPVGLLFD